MTALTPVAISPVEDIVADLRAGRIVILVDEEDRENEGDLYFDVFGFGDCRRHRENEDRFCYGH